MSTFSGLSTALSSLIAQRQALNVSGQNIANANTVGYTRQRADLQSVSSAAVRSMFSTPLGAGTGVNSVGIARLGDEFLDARLRTQTSQSAHFASVSTSLQRSGVRGDRAGRHRPRIGPAGVLDRVGGRGERPRLCRYAHRAAGQGDHAHPPDRARPTAPSRRSGNRRAPKPPRPSPRSTPPRRALRTSTKRFAASWSRAARRTN